jgi:hypothetical protein
VIDGLTRRVLPSERARARPRTSLVVDLFLAVVGDQSLSLRFLARELSRSADCVGSFPGFALGRFLISPPLFHFAKYTFALHLLLQDAKSLIDVVVANEYLQRDILL